MTVLSLSNGTLLRRLHPSDLPRFWQTRNDPELARYQGWSKMTGAEARGFLQEMATAPLFTPGGWCQIAIADQSAPNLLLGDIGLYLVPDGSEVEFGITLARDVQHRGHAIRALDAALDLIWRKSPAQTAVGIADYRNLPSIRLMQRTGFVPDTTFATEFRGRPCIETSRKHHRPSALRTAA